MCNGAPINIEARTAKPDSKVCTKHCLPNPPSASIKVPSHKPPNHLWSTDTHLPSSGLPLRRCDVPGCLALLRLSAPFAALKPWRSAQPPTGIATLSTLPLALAVACGQHMIREGSPCLSAVHWKAWYVLQPSHGTDLRCIGNACGGCHVGVTGVFTP
jgi:hypothetical protein